MAGCLFLVKLFQERIRNRYVFETRWHGPQPKSGLVRPPGAKKSANKCIELDWESSSPPK